MNHENLIFFRYNEGWRKINEMERRREEEILGK